MLSSFQSERASRRLIQSDLRFSIAVLSAVAANKDWDETTSWLALSHFHYLSLVAYEVRNFAQRVTSVTAEPWAYELPLAASRHSNKLFNDTRKTQVQLLSEFVNGATRDRTWYLKNNRVPWLFRGLPSLRFLVNDTSVVFYNEQVLCTSHSIRFHAGLEPRAAQSKIVERASELAAYLSGLGDAQVEDWTMDDYFRGWRSDLVVARDARYEDLYAAMFPSVPAAEAMALAILRSHLVSLKLIREIVPVFDALAPATFKFRFAGVWQIIETLSDVLAPESDLAFPDCMRDELRALLSAGDVKLMRTRGARSLRNVLVHYGLGSVDPAALNFDDPLLGLSELLLGGRPWLAVDQMLDEQIDAVLGLLATWAGPFGHTLKEPHE